MGLQSAAQAQWPTLPQGVPVYGDEVGVELQSGASQRMRTRSATLLHL